MLGRLPGPNVRRLALGATIVAGLALSIPYGWPDPGSGRAWDERFGLQNVAAILSAGAFEPANAFHPSLSYLPQTLALGAVDACGCLELGTGTNSVFLPRPEASGRERPLKVSALGYRSCRLFQALLGAVAQLLLYRVARTVVSPWTAVGLAAVLGFVPWHLWSAGICNEEAGLIVATLFVAWATLAATQRGDAVGALIVGLAIGAAFSTKLNGGFTGLPFALWSAAEARTNPRALTRLALAVVVAAATFCVLNPHFLTRFDMVRQDFGYTVDLYEEKATRETSGRLHVLASGLTSPASSAFLGPALAVFAAIGLIVTWLPGAGALLQPGDRLRLRLLSLFPLSYVTALAMGTPHFDEHNMVSVLPFALVLAGAGATAAVAGTHRAFGARWAKLVAAVAIAAVLPVLIRGVEYVYAAAVPTTADVARSELTKVLRRGLLVARVYPLDHAWKGPRLQRGRALEFAVGEEDQAVFDRARLALLDGWVVERRNVKALADLEGARIVRPRLFRARGPRLYVDRHPWRRVDSRPAATSVADDGQGLTVELDTARRSDLHATHSSLSFAWSGGADELPCLLRLADGAVVPLHLRRGRAAGISLGFSERFPATVDRATLSCGVSNPLVGPVEVLDWLPAT